MADAEEKTIDSLGIELVALIVDHCDVLTRPILPFVSCKFAAASLLRRRLARASSDRRCTHRGDCREIYVYALVKAHRPSLLIWAHTFGALPLPTDTCQAVAVRGDLPTLWWVRAQGCPWDSDTCAYAARYGYLALLQWSRAQGCPWDRAQCERLAARGGHTAVVDWIKSLS